MDPDGTPTSDAPATHSAALARHLIEGRADAVIYADREGTVRVWNEGAVAVFGFSAHEGLGANLDLIIPEHLRAARWLGFDAALRRGTTTGDRKARLTRGTHRDPDRRLYVAMTFALVTSDDGTVTGSVAVARDVTDSHLAEVARGPAARQAERQAVRE